MRWRAFPFSTLVSFAFLAAAGCAIAPEKARADLVRVTATEPAHWTEDWSDADWLERLNAVEADASSESADRVATSQLFASVAARHPSPSVRIAALEGLVPLGVDDVRVPALAAALDDRSPKVREYAAGIALPIVGPSARKEYARLLGPEQPASVRQAALMQLVAAPPDPDTERELTERVLDCVDDLDPGLRFHACAVLAKAAPDGPIDADPRVAAGSWRDWWRARLVKQPAAASAESR